MPRTRRWVGSAPRSGRCSARERRGEDAGEWPTRGFTAITGYLAFSPAMLACAVDGQPVTPQPGDFYAGWITPDVVGPFKGIPVSHGW